MPKETSRPATTWLSTPGRSYLLPGVRRSNATSSELIRIIEYNFKYHYIKHRKMFYITFSILFVPEAVCDADAGCQRQCGLAGNTIDFN